eukprot:2386152-Rhodomonas_salina.2
MCTAHSNPDTTCPVQPARDPHVRPEHAVWHVMSPGPGAKRPLFAAPPWCFRQHLRGSAMTLISPSPPSAASAATRSVPPAPVCTLSCQVSTARASCSQLLLARHCALSVPECRGGHQEMRAREIS